ncbi:CopG family transcriptional regulator [Xylanimonas protaetiae]|uniref:CopG family transcriptional regulator n=1 Tax=Xylanimonas protaetiae TaxID=2509457 RepID=A0A4P6F347_9MICO|nr:CopG family transcriptional regulator [Xylanimonas protaetiae]QAY70280.1 CopG family transcriptional regulator [Xylanimonas protaetiae]
MKPAIFLPDELGERFDAVAKAHNMNRSEFFQRAGTLYADALERDDKTARINDAVDFVGAQTAAAAAASARALIDTGAWEW